MQLARNTIQGAAGGLLAGSLLGLTEALYHLASSGAPDLLSPVYGLVLYGLVGLGLGLGGAIVLSLIRRSELPEPFVFAFGMVCGTAPVMAFVLRYLLNKVVYAEQGLPLSGYAILLALVGGSVLLTMTFVRWWLGAGGAFLLQGRGLLATWGGLFVLTSGAALAPVSEPGADQPHGKAVPAALKDAPNVLWIMVDTLRADHLGSYGAPESRTPTFDALGEDGVVFEQTFAQASWTRASGASMFTSRIPSSHTTATKASRLPDDVETWAEAFQSAGMTTGALINNINLTATFNFDQGFDTFVYEAPAYALGGSESVFSLTLYKVVHKVVEKLGGPKVVDRFYQPADKVLADARAFMDANADSRWALFVHLMEPHDPYFEHPSLTADGGAEYNGVGFARAEVEHPSMDDVPYLKRVYKDEVTFLDQKLAPFIAALKADGLYDNLAIVVTADHGEEFGEHGGFWHGTTLYDEQIHVPFLLRTPRADDRGVRVPWQVRSIDIAPTLAELLGIDAPSSWEGQSALDLVARAKARVATPPGDLDPCALRAEAAAHGRAAVSEEDFEGNVLSSIRGNGWKYLTANEGNPRGLPTVELFDTHGDPFERTNMVDWAEPLCGEYAADAQSQLAGDLKLVLDQAKSGAATSASTGVSAAECERLKALGYMSADEDCGS